MRRLLASLAILAILWAPLSASGRAKTGTNAKAGTKSSQAKASKPPRAKASKPGTPARRASAKASPRDSKGRITRNGHARLAFMRQTGYPHGRPGYVVDHIVPLACGGADAPSNMQWQTVVDAKAKDRVERVECR